MRLMFQGCTPGPDVKVIQSRLNEASVRIPSQASKLPPLGPDGIFGAKTAKRVVEFQAKNGLVVDGIVGFKTESMLNDLLGNPTHLTPEHVPPAQKKALAKAFDGSSQKTGAKMPGGMAAQKAMAKMGGRILA